MILGDGLVDAHLDIARQRRGEPLHREVHARAVGVHLPAGDLRAVVGEDQAAEQVQRGVGAHHAVAEVPVQLPAERRAHRRQVARVGRDLMPDDVVRLAQRGQRQIAPVYEQRAPIRHLPAAARIERRAVERQRAALDRDHRRVEAAQVAILVIEQDRRWCIRHRASLAFVYPPGPCVALTRQAVIQCGQPAATIARWLAP